MNIQLCFNTFVVFYPYFATMIDGYVTCCDIRIYFCA